MQVRRFQVGDKWETQRGTLWETRFQSSWNPAHTCRRREKSRYHPVLLDPTAVCCSFLLLRIWDTGRSASSRQPKPRDTYIVLQAKMSASIYVGNPLYMHTLLVTILCLLSSSPVLSNQKHQYQQFYIVLLTVVLAVLSGFYLIEWCVFGRN